MNRHIVESYDSELAALKKTLLEMGSMTEEQLDKALTAVIRADEALALRIVDRDHEIDERERAAQTAAVKLLALRQPMASDLRDVVTAIKMSADLERIADLAKGIARRAPLFKSAAPQAPLRRLRGMVRQVRGQLRDALRAYAEADSALAERVWRRDREVDDWHSSLFRETLTYMMEDPRMIGTCTHVLFMAKNVERMGDRCASIAGQVYYAIHGSALPDDRPKGEDISTISLEPPKSGTA